MTDKDYGLSPEKQSVEISAPAIEYLPPKPKTYSPKIGLVGAGGISELHLKNYLACGYDVAAIANRTISKAEKARDDYYPSADVYDDYRELLQRDDIEVIDATPHCADRLPIMRDAIVAGKHVLSQKPFVMDLDDGEALVRLADEHNVKLAVNQNGRWAPHFSYLQNAIASGVIGDVTSIDFSLQWDQTWIAGIEALEKIHHLILFDFGIHWFDIATTLMGDQKAKTVFASATRFDSQHYGPPAIASAIIDFPTAQVRMSFHGHTRLGEQDVTTVVGTKGTLRSSGPGLNDQPNMDVFLESGHCLVPLTGCWFESGFQGAMGELLCAIEEDRAPSHSAANNLRSLELAFAGIASANTCRVIDVGTVRTA